MSRWHFGREKKMKRGHSSMMYLDWVLIGLGGLWFMASGELLGLLVVGAGVAFHFVHPED